MNFTILWTLEIRPREKFPHLRSNRLRCRRRTTANVFQFQALRRILDYSRCTKRGCRRKVLKVHCVDFAFFHDNSSRTVCFRVSVAGSGLGWTVRPFEPGGVWADKAWKQLWGDFRKGSGELGKVPGKVVGKAEGSQWLWFPTCSVCWGYDLSLSLPSSYFGLEYFPFELQTHPFISTWIWKMPYLLLAESPSHNLKTKEDKA